MPLRGTSGGAEAHHGKHLSFAGQLVPLSVEPRNPTCGATCPQEAALRLDGTTNVSDRPRQRKPQGLTQEAFDSLLAFLGPTPEEAGQKYEEIRRKLTKIFTCRGCSNPEELFDETMDRVARKAPELAKTYEGDPALYCYGVARLVHLESLKKKPVALPLPEPEPGEDNQRELDCLEGCMRVLPSGQSELIRDYYRKEKSAKIEDRKELAARLGIATNALRIRAHRIRNELLKCVTACLERSGEGALAGSD